MIYVEPLRPGGVRLPMKKNTGFWGFNVKTVRRWKTNVWVRSDFERFQAALNTVKSRKVESKKTFCIEKCELRTTSTLFSDVQSTILKMWAWFGSTVYRYIFELIIHVVGIIFIMWNAFNAIIALIFHVAQFSPNVLITFQMPRRTVDY